MYIHMYTHNEVHRRGKCGGLKSCCQETIKKVEFIWFNLVLGNEPQSRTRFCTKWPPSYHPPKKKKVPHSYPPPVHQPVKDCYRGLEPSKG